MSLIVDRCAGRVASRYVCPPAEAAALARRTAPAYPEGMNDHMNGQTRVPSGAAGGGQFAATHKPETDVDLGTGTGPPPFYSGAVSPGQDGGTRFDAARKSWFAAHKESVQAAAQYLRDTVRREYPAAAYLALEDSDQSDSVWPGEVYDADGRVIGDMSENDEAMDACGWLPQSDNHWEDSLAVGPSRPEVLRRSPGSLFKVD